MQLKELVGKNIIVDYINPEENSSIVGELREIDETLHVIQIHTYYNQADIFIPLHTIAKIKEKY